jgi:hypothetical protein
MRQATLDFRFLMNGTRISGTLLSITTNPAGLEQPQYFSELTPPPAGRMRADANEA